MGRSVYKICDIFLISGIFLGTLGTCSCQIRVKSEMDIAFEITL